MTTRDAVPSHATRAARGSSEMDTMDRHDVRHHPHPAHAHAAWAAPPWRWLSIAHARRVPLLALFLGVLAPLWAFGALAEDVWTHEGFAWDAPILRAIHQVATPGLDRRVIAVTTAGGARSHPTLPADSRRPARPPPLG